MSELKEVLKTRGNNYGDFRSVARISQTLKMMIKRDAMSQAQMESVDMIASKLARIACGDCNHRDSWLDIAGYAMLAVSSIDAASLPLEEPPDSTESEGGEV